MGDVVYELYHEYSTDGGQTWKTLERRYYKKINKACLDRIEYIKNVNKNSGQGHGARAKLYEYSLVGEVTE